MAIMGYVERANVWDVVYLVKGIYIGDQETQERAWRLWHKVESMLKASISHYRAERSIVAVS